MGKRQAVLVKKTILQPFRVTLKGSLSIGIQLLILLSHCHHNFHRDCVLLHHSGYRKQQQYAVLYDRNQTLNPSVSTVYSSINKDCLLVSALPTTGCHNKRQGQAFIEKKIATLYRHSVQIQSEEFSYSRNSFSSHKLLEMYVGTIRLDLSPKLTHPLCVNQSV